MGVDIYSSKTVAWIFKESKWGEEAKWALLKSVTVFLNDCLHIMGHSGEYPMIFAVDIEGNT